MTGKRLASGTSSPQESLLPFRLPKTPLATEFPVWTGRGFSVDGTSTPVLAYGLSASGWSDELTEFHEETSGENHYIDVASRRHAMQEIETRVKQPEATIIDIGCSSGFMIKSLRARFPKATIIGADYIRGALERLAESLPDVPFLQLDLTQCPLPDDIADAVVLLNVLEHIEDHRAAIRHLFRILKPGGFAVIEVPAGPHLYDIYDKQLMHVRRYSMPELAQELEGAGFRLVHQSYLGFLLYPAFYAVKKRNQKFLKSSASEQRRKVAKQIKTSSSSPVLHWLMRCEAALRGIIPYPTGIRCLVTCQKPASVSPSGSIGG